METKIEFSDNQQDMDCSDMSGMLGEKEIKAIEESLKKVCPYGEVRLVVERGRLRWLITQQSFDMNKLK